MVFFSVASLEELSLDAADQSTICNKVDSLPASLHPYLSEPKNDFVRAERLGATLLLIRLLDSRGGSVDPVILRDKNGRPYFQGSGVPDFNLSHSGGVCAAAVSDGKVGIDVQFEQVDFDVFRLAERFFSDNEQMKLRASHDPRTMFFEIWTKKEALGKYLGGGLTSVLKKADVFSAEKDLGISFLTSHIEKNGRRFALALCSARGSDFHEG